MQALFSAGFRQYAIPDSANPHASPGGTPEPEDGGDLVATLVREAFQENQVRVGATAYLGYQGGAASWSCPVCAGADGRGVNDDLARDFARWYPGSPVSGQQMDVAA